MVFSLTRLPAGFTAFRVDKGPAGRKAECLLKGKDENN